jgi:crotonobetainyl-CoA:carnitine CoA-transferase CaiB-like acyl-CoA transferase
MGYPLYFTMYGDQPPARAGVRHATVVPYGAYRCGDGDQVLLAVQSDQHWTDFCTIVVGHPEWIADPRFDSVTNRRVNRDTLESLIEDAFTAFSRSEITARLEQADIPYGDLNTIAQFADHPQLAGRERWRDVELPNGTMRALLPPMGFDHHEPPMGPIPAVGQHTKSILTELGYSPETIATLKQSAAIQIS